VELQLLLDFNVIAYLCLILLKHQFVVLGRLSHGLETFTATHRIDARISLVNHWFSRGANHQWLLLDSRYQSSIWLLSLSRLLLFVVFKLLLLKYLVFLKAHIHEDLNRSFNILDKSTGLAVSQLLALFHQQILGIVVYLQIIINMIWLLPRWILS
jgi:hypothetical protein